MDVQFVQCIIYSTLNYVQYVKVTFDCLVIFTVKMLKCKSPKC